MRVAAIVLGVLIGVAAGIGGFTFVYAHGTSYLRDDPRACVNCHVMRAQLDGWSHGSHRVVATCNDCHTPHRLVGHYLTKAVNGWNHSRAFTTGDFPEPILAGERNARIARESCRECHQQVIDAMGIAGHGEPLPCSRCHGAVGHPV